MTCSLSITINCACLISIAANYTITPCSILITNNLSCHDHFVCTCTMCIGSNINTRRHGISMAYPMYNLVSFGTLFPPVLTPSLHHIASNRCYSSLNAHVICSWSSTSIISITLTSLSLPHSVFDDSNDRFSAMAWCITKEDTKKQKKS